MSIIRGPIKPYIFWIKIILAIFLAKIRPDKTNFSALTNLTIDFDFELNYQKYKCWIRSVYFVLFSQGFGSEDSVLGLEDLIGVTLVDEDADSKVVDVAADIEESIGNSFVTSDSLTTMFLQFYDESK